MELVRGYLQAYDWGAVDGLATWAGSTGAPQAELWFGNHPNGPSPLADGTGTATGAMPILTKLLAAGRPLSIQIHPAEPLAARMYSAQQADPGLPRLLADRYGKAEILIALEPFVILEGFRDPVASAAIFTGLGPQFGPARAALEAGDLATAIRDLLALSGEAVPWAEQRLADAIAAAGLPEADVIAEVVESFPGDPGVFVAALLTARTLQPGQGVYVDPGTVHAYVRGVGLEVMTNSDNVLRLGLTSKTVAVDAALEAVDLLAQPHALAPPEVAGVRRYAPAGAPFEVSLLRDCRGESAAGPARIVLCLSGEASAGQWRLGPGDALLIPAGEPRIDVRADGSCVIAQEVTT